LLPNAGNAAFLEKKTLKGRVKSGESNPELGERCTKTGHTPVDAMHLLDSEEDIGAQF
jgi:hypothetical protein